MTAFYMLWCQFPCQLSSAFNSQAQDPYPPGRAQGRVLRGSLDSSISCPLPPSELITALANVNVFMALLTLGLFPNPGQVEKGPGTGGQGKGG